jgi:hypothetical protein
MVNTYVLVNPYIEGSFEKSVKAKNSIEAGTMLYTNLSEHFNNNVPKFLFTVQKGSSGKGKHYSFKVKENKKDNQINFSIEPYSIKNEGSAYKGLQDKISQFKKKVETQKIETQKGGAKAKKNTKKPPTKAKATTKAKKTTKKDKKSSDDEILDTDDIFSDDDDFDDSPDHNTKRVQRYVPNTDFPIYHWYYDPYVYNLSSVFVPTFYSYVTPYIELSLR